MRRLAAFLFVLIGPATGLWLAAQAPVHLVIMHTNDLHGQLLPRDGLGGIAQVATVIRRAKPDLVLDAGDISTGTFLSDEFKGMPTIQAMNRIGYTSGTIGNHEFDYGQAALRTMLRQARFPVLSANLETPISEIKPYAVVTAKGIRFGIIGLTTEEVKTKSHPKNLGGVTVLDMVKILERLLPEIRRKADFVIATVHIEDADERRIASAFPEIRLIIGGHSHTPTGPIWLGQTLVTKTGASGRNVGRVDLDFQNKKLSHMEGKLIPVKDVPPGADVAKILEPYNEKVKIKMGEVIGEATDDVTYSKTTESPLANMIADAFREKGKTQIAIHNVGGIRANISKGKVTWGSIFEVLPFQNTMVTLKLTGAQLKKTLEQGTGNVAVSGIRVQFDRKRPAGGRLLWASTLEGAPLDDSKLYSLTTNDFVLAGGDGFTEFAKGTDIVDSGFYLRDAFVDYVKSRRVLTPKTDGRIVVE
jgi:2',3'-cyclic-nucleotide 2'-phosphodiesterase (5'-nucleotidase family)